MATEMATLAGGCFWCLEAVYEQVRGVEKVVSGYTGGTVERPTYRQVCTGATGHAEAVQLTYDADAVSFEELVELFFTVHDPTTLNRQGPDAGTQYRSAVFYHSEEQRRIAEGAIADLTARGVWPAPIVTEVVPLAEFYEAEEYHQQYFRRNPGQPYCQGDHRPESRQVPQGARRRAQGVAPGAALTHGRAASILTTPRGPWADSGLTPLAEAHDPTS